jgi:VIT1/CCC1 family predicted Fe2+/Mn2+ transporter
MARPATRTRHRPHVGGHQHRDVSGGRLRPTVFGVMDGLVTNVSLIAGVGAGSGSATAIALAGVAGLVGGAFSMATGEYTSVLSQNELVHSEVELERQVLRAQPRREQAELAAAYMARGIGRDVARNLARQIAEDPIEELRLHAQEELGVDPSQLPSPAVAAASSFASFGIGALIPLLPYLAGASLLWLSLAISAVALALVGAAVAKLTGRRLVYGTLRQLALGVLAAGVTYAIGTAIGAGIS